MEKRVLWRKEYYGQKSIMDKKVLWTDRSKIELFGSVCTVPNFYYYKSVLFY